jgi:uncharacterized protein (TIGR03086 family)
MTSGAGRGLLLVTDHPDFGPAVAATSAVVRGVPGDALGRPTPSPAYTVGDLLDHVDGFSRWLQYTARKAAIPDDADAARPGSAEMLAPGWRERIPRQLEELAACWRDPAAWEGQATAGTVSLPAAAAAMFALDEVVVHGWELARATGQPYAPDEATVRALVAFLREQPRSEELFGPVVEQPPGAPAIDVLVGLTGRDPAWRG